LENKLKNNPSALMDKTSLPSGTVRKDTILTDDENDCYFHDSAN
jgi:hypothetical protein